MKGRGRQRAVCQARPLGLTEVLSLTRAPDLPGFWEARAERNRPTVRGPASSRDAVSAVSSE